MDTLEYGERFLDSLSEPQVFEQLFNEWMQTLDQTGLWSPDNPCGRRIPWQLAGQASEVFRVHFTKPGLYLFGAYPLIPRYVGETGRTNETFDKRLFNRYFRKQGKSSAKILPQCLLAQKYEAEILDAIEDGRDGISAFPPDLIEMYIKNYGNGLVRLHGAVDFAKHGIDGIWFTILPQNNRIEYVRKTLEKSILRVANKWNNARNLPNLCNIDHGFEYRTHIDGPRIV